MLRSDYALHPVEKHHAKQFSRIRQAQVDGRFHTPGVHDR